MAVSERPRILVVEDGWVLAEVLCVSLPEAGFEPVGPAPSIAKARHLIGISMVDATILRSWGVAQTNPAWSLCYQRRARSKRRRAR